MILALVDSTLHSIDSNCDSSLHYPALSPYAPLQHNQNYTKNLVNTDRCVKMVNSVPNNT